MSARIGKSFRAGEAEGDEEVSEPRFRHQALAADVTQLLMRTAASCLTVSDKMLALGTATGSVHLLDYGGNEVERHFAQTHHDLSRAVCVNRLHSRCCLAQILLPGQMCVANATTLVLAAPIGDCCAQVKRYEAHGGRVNDLCFDERAEHVASCSDDGSVVVRSAAMVSWSAVSIVLVSLNSCPDCHSIWCSGRGSWPLPVCH